MNALNGRSRSGAEVIGGEVAFYYATHYGGWVQRVSFEDMNCSVAQCLEVVGEWWSLLIVRDAFLGVRRFDDFQARLGISRNILNQRLKRLVDSGVLERVPYRDNPPRSEYATRFDHSPTFSSSPRSSSFDMSSSFELSTCSSAHALQRSLGEVDGIEQ